MRRKEQQLYWLLSINLYHSTIDKDDMFYVFSQLPTVAAVTDTIPGFLIKIILHDAWSNWWLVVLQNSVVMVLLS